MRVDMKLFKYLVNDADDGTVGIVRITSTFQDAGISAFQAKGKDVEGDIRTRFIDDAYYSEGDTDFGQASFHWGGRFPLISFPAGRGEWLHYVCRQRCLSASLPSVLTGRTSGYSCPSVPGPFHFLTG